MSESTLPPRARRPLQEVHTLGVRALLDALGPADTARFLQQYGPSLGNYTEDRHQWLDGLSLEDIIAQMEQESGEFG